MDYKFRLRDGRSSSPVRLTRQTAHSVEIIREEDGKGKLGGFGFTLLYEKPPIVGTITPNSPAERAGLKCKDVIISVNDNSVEDLPHKDVVKLIENTPSTGVWLTVREADSKSETPDGFSGLIKKQPSVSVPNFSPEDYISRSRSSSFNLNRSYNRQHSPSPPTSHKRQRSFDEMRRLSDIGRTSSPSKLTVTSRVPSSNSLGTSSPRSGSLPRAPMRATVLVHYIGPVEIPHKWSARGMSSRCIRECTRRIVTERGDSPLEIYLELGLNGLKMLNSNKNTLVHYGRKELFYCGVHLDDDQYFGIVTRHSKLIDEMGQSVPTVMSETTHPKIIHRCHVFCILPPERVTEMQVHYSGAGNIHQTTKVCNAHAIVHIIREIYNQEMVLDAKSSRPLSSESQDLKVPEFGYSGASVSSEGSSTSSLSSVSMSSSHDHTPQSKNKHMVDLTPRIRGSFDFEDGKYSRNRDSFDRHLLHGLKAAQTPERDVLSSSMPQFSKWTPSPESFKHHRYEDIDRFPNLVSKRDSFSSSNWSGPSGGSETYFQVTDTQPPPGPVYATVNKPKAPPLVRQSSDSSLQIPPDPPANVSTDSKIGGMPPKNGPTSSSMTSLWSTTTAGEEPQGRVGGWAASFDRLLEDPLGLHYFMTFLKQEHSEENLLFWLACEEFKKTVAAVPTMLQPSSEKLFNDFVDPVLSEQEVNLDDKYRKDLETRLKSPTTDMFDETQHQVYRLMRMDSFPRFTRSQLFKDLLVQDLDGKQLPVLDITPMPPVVEGTVLQESNDPTKTKGITRTSSTKERHRSFFGRKTRGENDVHHDDDKKKKEFKRKGSKKEPHQPVEQQRSLPQDEDEKEHRQWLSEQSNVFEIVLSSSVTKLLPVPKSGSVREAIAPLLARQKFSFETVDIKSAASLQLVDLDMPASTLSNQHLVVMQRQDTFVLALPDSELLLPADANKTTKDICGPALAKEGLDPNYVVLYVFGSRVPLDMNIRGNLLQGQKVVVKMSTTSTGSAAPPQDTNSNINDERQSNEPLKSSSAADMDNLFQMLMRVQGDTLEEQRSAEPTPEPTSNQGSPMALSSKGTGTSTFWQRESSSPHKTEFQRPGSRTKRRVFGHDDIDRSVSSPLHISQSDSTASLNLSSNSPIPSASPATLSQESDPADSKARPGSRNSASPVPQNDTGQYMCESRNKNISPSFDKARVRHELAQWAAKGKGGDSTVYQPVNGKVSLPPRANSLTRYQQSNPYSPPPALARTDHHRPTEVNRRSHSPTPPMGSPPPNSTISYHSNLDSWVLQADGKGQPELPHSPPVRYQSETPLSPSVGSNRTRQPVYQSAQPTYQTTQGWKPPAQNISVQPGAIPGRHYSQGRPQVANDPRLLIEGDRLLRKELEETRAEQHHYHLPNATMNHQMLPQHRQLPLSPPNSASSIISASQQRQHYMSIPGGSVNETRV